MASTASFFGNRTNVMKVVFMGPKTKLGHSKVNPTFDSGTVRCKSTLVWLDIIPVNWAEASERIHQHFVYIFADFKFSNDLWSLWVRILQQIWLP